MAFTVNVDQPELERRLALIVARYNARNGTNLATRQWITVHLREIATNEDLSAAGTRIAEEKRAQLEAEIATELQAEKDRLLGLVS